MMLDAHLPLRSVLRAASARSGGQNGAALSKIAHNELHARVDTPYGTAMKEMDVEGTLGTVKVDYICPFALLFHLASMSSEFASLLLSCLNRESAKICIYCDEVVPGNVFRPGKNRGIQAVYWTILQLPSWLRDRANSLGWFTFIYAGSRQLQEAGITMSMFMAKIFKIFWSSDLGCYNFETVGLRLPIRATTFHICGYFCCFLGDEKSIKETFSLKGASGSKPCANCSNVVGRVDQKQMVEGLAHVLDPDMSKWHAHTTATFAEMVRRLSTANASGNLKMLQTLQQVLGIVYEPRGVIFDPNLLQLTKPPTTVYWDFMHCMYASGGIASYHVNQYARVLLAHGITLVDLDCFQKSIKWPKNAENERDIIRRPLCQ